MTNRGAIATLSLFLFSLGACVEQAEPDQLDTEAEALLGCPMWGCGENTPNMDAWFFHELNTNGLVNDEGVRIIRFQKGLQQYHPHVDGARLYGTWPGLPVLDGADLVGAYFLVATSSPSRVFQIQIKSVSNVTKFWIGPNETPPNETYDLQWKDALAPGDPRPLCKNAPSRLDPEGDIWPKTLEAILFTGDRYDVEHKTVTHADYASTDGWFNVGCAGSALAKLHLNRHTTAGSTSVHSTTRLMRQTMLKMYVSDICNTGDAFTVAGTPLHWQNTTHWQNLSGLEASKEAFWGPDGALCMENPRQEALYGALIASICPATPKCSDVLPSWPNQWYRGAYIVTANP